MTSPYDDISQWCAVASSMVNDPDEFLKYIPELNKFISSIIETGKLPEPISSYTDTFLSNIKSQFVDKILNVGHVTDEQLKEIESFIHSVLNLGNYGITTNSCDLIYLIELILSSMGSKFVTSNTSAAWEVNLPKYCVSIGTYDNAIKCIHSTIDTIQNLVYLINICIRISTFVPNYDFWVFAITSTEKLYKIVTTMKIREVKTELVSTIYLALKTNAINQQVLKEEFFQKWIELITYMMRPEIFRNRLFGFQKLKDLLETPSTSEIARQIIAKDPSVLDGSVLHEEFCSYIGFILNKLCEAKLVELPLISKLFSRYSTVYIAELPKFWGIFSTIAKSIEKRILSDFIDLLISPTTKDPSWYNMIELVGTSLGQRSDCKEEFIKLRDNLINLEEQGDKSALKVVSEIIQFHLSEEEFNSLITKITSKKITLESISLLKNVCSVYAFDNYDLANKLIENGLELLYSPELEDPQPVYDFMFNLCFMNTIVFTKEQFAKVYPLSLPDDVSKNAPVLSFINGLFDSDLINPDVVAEVINESELEINKNVLGFIQIFIAKSNDVSINSHDDAYWGSIPVRGNIKKLPIKYEDILWKLCMRKGIYQHTVCEELCRMYASNDESLKDSEMVNYFIDKWVNYIRKSENKSELVKLMSTFIRTIEFPIDVKPFNLIRHQQEPENFDVTIMTDSNTLQLKVSPNMLIAALQDKVYRLIGIPKSNFTLFKLSAPRLKGDVTVSSIATDGSLKLRARIVHDEKIRQNPCPPSRDCIPSIVLANNPRVMALLTEMLKDNVDELKNLLDLLPTFPSTLENIKQMSFVKRFDYQNFFDPTYPALFLYNLDGLNMHTNDTIKSAFLATDGFKYMLEIFTKCDFKVLSNIISYLTGYINENIIETYGQLALDNCMPVLAKFCSNNTEFVVIGSFINKFVETKSKLTLKDAANYVQYLLSSTDYIKKLFSQILVNVEFPLTDLTKFVKTADTSEFFEVLNSHINVKDDELTNYIYEQILAEPKAIHLIAAKELISKGFMSDEQKEKLVNYLIDKFLEYNETPRTKETMIAACNVIALCPNEKLYERLKFLHDNKSEWEEKKIDGDASAPKTGYVGLINLGATCFLNSTLQQFFMIPKLRNAIISYKGTDEFMIQLSTLFAKLLITKSNAITTEHLVKNWIGWDGEPMNPHSQQDANEFVLSLLDKLESGLNKEFIQEMFQETNIITIDGLTEEFHAERFDKQYAMTLGVKGVENFNDSLDKFMAVDYFTNENQYKPEGFDHKIDAMKHQKVAGLPPHLIIQLARFDYNYTNWERLKINTVLEIPAKVDLKSVTHNVESTKFTLHGVIIHMGSAQFGHYISYIKERKEDGKWFCFNDSFVHQVEESEVLKAASGSDEGKSGYLLFYDRDDITENNDEVPEISEETKKAVDEENKILMQQRVLCSQGYNELMLSLAKSTDKKFVMCATRYFFDTLPYYINSTKSTEQIAENLLKNLSSDDDISIVQKDLSHTFFYSHEAYRDSVEKILCSTKGIDFDFLLSLMSKGLEKYYYLKQYFNVINHYANEKIVSEGYKFLFEMIPAYKKTKPDLREAYFHSALELRGLFFALSKFKLTEDFNNALNDKFLQFIFETKSDPECITAFLKALPDQQNVKAKFSSFIDRCSVFVNFVLLTSVVIRYYGAEGFDILPKIKSKVGDNIATIHDFAYVNAILAHDKSMKSLYLDNMDKWLMQYMVCDDLDARNYATKMIAFLAPIDSFDPSTSITARTGGQVYKMEKYDCKEEAQKIADFMVSKLDNLVEIITKLEGRIGCDFIELLGNFSKECKVDFDVILRTLYELESKVKPFDNHIREFVILLSKHKIEIDSEFLIRNISANPKELEWADMEMMRFAVVLFPEIKDEFINEEFAAKFTKLYAFPTGVFIKLHYDGILNCVRRLCKLHPKSLVNVVDENLEVLVNRNFSTVLTILHETNTKRNILKYLPDFINKLQHYNKDKLVELSINCDDGTENVCNLLMPLSTMQGISHEKRALIWNYLTEKMGDESEEFIKTSYKDVIKEDRVLFAKYVSKFMENRDFTPYIEIITNSFAESLDTVNIMLDIVKKAKDVSIWRDFVLTAAKCDVTGSVDTMCSIMELIPLVCNSEDDLINALLPFHERINKICEFIIEIFQNGGEPPKEEMSKAEDLLTVVMRHNMYSGPIIKNAGQLMSLINDKEEYASLFKVIRRVILV